MNHVVVLRGVPGSGKGFYIKNTFPNAYVVSADHFFTNPITKEYKWKRSLLGIAHETCYNNFTKAIENNVSLVIVDNTNISLKEIRKYLEYAKGKSYEVSIHTIICDPEVAYKRYVHNVPLETIKRMHNKLLATNKIMPNDWIHYIKEN